MEHLRFVRERVTPSAGLFAQLARCIRSDHVTRAIVDLVMFRSRTLDEAVLKNTADQVATWLSTTESNNRTALDARHFGSRRGAASGPGP